MHVSILNRHLIYCNSRPYLVCISMVVIVHVVYERDTTAKLLTLAHFDLDYRLYLPLSQLIIIQFPSRIEHPTAFFFLCLIPENMSCA